MGVFRNIVDDNQFTPEDVNVIGLPDRSEGDEEPEVLFSSALTRTLEQNDALVIYGWDKDLDALETAVASL